MTQINLWTKAFVLAYGSSEATVQPGREAVSNSAGGSRKLMSIHAGSGENEVDLGEPIVSQSLSAAVSFHQ